MGHRCRHLISTISHFVSPRLININEWYVQILRRRDGDGRRQCVSSTQCRRAFCLYLPKGKPYKTEENGCYPHVEGRVSTGFEENAPSKSPPACAVSSSCFTTIDSLSKTASSQRSPLGPQTKDFPNEGVKGFGRFCQVPNERRKASS